MSALRGTSILEVSERGQDAQGKSGGRERCAGVTGFKYVRRRGVFRVATSPCHPTAARAAGRVEGTMHQDAPPPGGVCTPEGRGSCTSKLHLHDVSQLSTHLPISSSDASPGATRPTSRESPRSRPRAKSSSVRMLEEEGENMQFQYFGHLDQSRVSEDMLVSISCLTAVRNLQETGRFGEAQVCVESVLIIERVLLSIRATHMLLITVSFSRTSSKRWSPNPRHCASRSWPVSSLLSCSTSGVHRRRATPLTLWKEVPLHALRPLL